MQTKTKYGKLGHLKQVHLYNNNSTCRGQEFEHPT